MNYSFGIILAEFNKDITDKMLKSASDRIEELNSSLIKVVKVPGSYEIPLIAQELLEQNIVDGLVCLGFIERGETLHGEVMGNVVHSQLIRLQEKHKKPMGLGIIGPGALEDQAHSRAIPYGKAAVDACYKMITIMKSLSGIK